VTESMHSKFQIYFHSIQDGWGQMTGFALETSVVMALTAKSEAGSNYPFKGVQSLNSRYSAAKLQNHLCK
jgi:hypothetical protein